MKKKILSVMVMGMLCVMVLAGCGQSGQSDAAADTDSRNTGVEADAETGADAGRNGDAAQVARAASVDEIADDWQGTVEGALSGKHHVEITMKDKGTIYVELDADAAPISATNFVKLAKEGFYDGLTFHRIIEGFMMQGGDPTGTGMGGSDRTIKGEFASNGVENPLSHTRGTISMARSQMNDSASSQFFIMHQDYTGLDGDYAAFGHVTEGMEIVDDICESAVVQDNNGTVAAQDQPVIEKIVVVD